MQVTFPNTLAPAAVEMLEKVLPERPQTEFDGEEEEPMLEVMLHVVTHAFRAFFLIA